MSRLSARFSGRKCFIPFVTAGYPDLERTEEIVLALVGAGADIVEIGMPFSDPVADGPVIQRSSMKALANGVRTEDVFELIRRIRARTDAGLVLMTYCNPILRFGLDRLDATAREIGLDGVLISDLTPEEYRRIGVSLKTDTIFLAAPTTNDERLKEICEATRGFLYLVARTGVTGSKTDVGQTIPAMMQRIRRHSEIPVAAGFGLSTADDVAEVWRYAEGAIVGSAIIRFIEEHENAADLASQVARFASEKLIPAR